MPNINQDLLSRLSTRLGVSKRQVYARIEAVAARTMLERHLAALVLASENGINIQKYLTPEDRSLIRGAVNGGPPPSFDGIADAGSKNVRPAMRPKKPSGPKPKNDTVFVVHGRNEALRKSMFDFLRALGLKPLEWEKALLLAKGANPHIDDVLDSAMAKVRAVVVLFSPDDEARLKPQYVRSSDGASEKKPRGQPRPNVIFEAGLALGRHPEKTILVECGKLKGFTDIAGKHVVRLTDDYPKRNDLANRLKKIGCDVDRDGNDWTTVGDFSG